MKFKYPSIQSSVQENDVSNSSEFRVSRNAVVVAVGVSLKRFDSHRVTPSRNTDACLSLDLPSPSRGKAARRGGRRRLLSALSFSICMSHPAAAPGTICNAHTTPRSANTRALHAQVVIRWCSLPLTAQWSPLALSSGDLELCMTLARAGKQTTEMS